MFYKHVFTFITRKKPTNDIKIKGRLAGLCILKHK